MRKRNELSAFEMADFATWYFDKYFKSNKLAAEYFNTNSPTISQVKNGKQPPNDDMLRAFGYTKEKVYKRVK